MYNLNTTHSNDIDQLMGALSTAQGEIKIAIKNRKNPFYNSEYADLPAVWEACRQPLSKNGIAVVQTVEGDNSQYFLCTMIAHKSGQWIKSKLPIFLTPKKDKNSIPLPIDNQIMGSAISYARRYSLSSMLGICQGEEDDDGNESSSSYQNFNQTAPKKNDGRLETYLNKWNGNKEKFKLWLVTQQVKYKWLSDDDMINDLEKNSEFVKLEFNKWLAESSVSTSANKDNPKA
jgi:hypothetical protein